MSSRALAARRVCRWVTDRVRDVAPAGVGRWGPAWDLLAAPPNDFLDALAAWEATGAIEDREVCRLAGAAVVSAWREAAREWEDAGRPTELWTPKAAETAEAM